MAHGLVFVISKHGVHGEYVANSGLIVSPPFRKSGVAKAIKKRIFDLSREKYPNSKIFGLTTVLLL
jgi:hypothetical protein